MSLFYNKHGWYASSNMNSWSFSSSGPGGSIFGKQVYFYNLETIARETLKFIIKNYTGYQLLREMRLITKILFYTNRI